VYNAVWATIVGEELLYVREVGNIKDRNVLSVWQGSNIIEHLP